MKDLSNNAYTIFLYVCFYSLYKAYVVGTHLNCIDKSVQFKWVPTTYAKRRRDKHYTCCNLKTTELLVCALIGACVVILLNTVSGFEFIHHNLVVALLLESKAKPCKLNSCVVSKQK